MSAEQRAHVWESRAKAWRDAFERVRAELEVKPNETVLGAIQRLKREAAAVVRLRAEWKRQLQHEHGVWICECCSRPKGPDVPAACVDDEGCSTCEECYPLLVEHAKHEREVAHG